MNPFADYGQIVQGRRFIGRLDEIKLIRQRVMGDAHGNLSITGLPRIGKSSLAWNAINLCERPPKLLLIGASLGEFETAKDFYLWIVRELAEELTDIASLDIQNSVRETSDRIIQVGENIVQRNIEFRRVIRFLKSQGFRIIIIIDEFDAAAEIFKQSDFQFLREISTRPETKICLVTISRRSVQEIEATHGNISNFYGVFADLRLGPFSDLELLKYWEFAEKEGVEVSETYKGKVQFLVGGYPYLLDLINFHTFSMVTQGVLFDEDGKLFLPESEVMLSLFMQFESCLKVLENEKLYTKAFQLVFGPVYDVNQLEENRLIQYRFIREIPKNQKSRILGREMGVEKAKEQSYSCFSDFFMLYWSTRSLEVDYWPIWRDTEREVRAIVSEYLEEKFGLEWDEGYLRKYPSENREKAVQRLRETRKTYAERFGNSASNNLIDYTNPKDLYELFIACDWQHFSLILGGEKKEWANKFRVLAEIRNPVAHNNMEFVSEENIHLAKSHCAEIIGKVREYKSSYENH